MTTRNPHVVLVTLEARTWASRRASRTGQPVEPEAIAAYVTKHYPDLKGNQLDYVLNWAKPAPRQWPGGPT